MNQKIRHLLDIIIVLIQKDLKVRYKNTLLGYLWSVAHPLAFATVFYVAFKVVIQIQVNDYVPFLISALFPWQWFSNSLSAAPLLFIANASIIKKVNFPRNMLPFTLVLQDLVHFIFSIPVIIFFLFLYGKTPGLNWLYGIPVLLVIQFLVTYGLTLIIASTNLFFRDIERLTTIALMLLFYCTPVIYPESMVPENFRFLLNFNPLAHMMVNWRNLFLYGKVDPVSIGISLGYAIIVYSIGHFAYKKLFWRFAEVL
jgi:lipopolysaccharide transport system permease protein